MSQRSLRLALLSLGAVALLSGCTVYVNQGPAARKNATKTTASRPTTPAKTTTPATTTTPTPTKPAVEPPTMTGRNAFGNGSIGAFRGYAYVVPDTTTKLPDFSRLVPFAKLFTDSFITQNQEFSGGFPGALMQDEWFGIRYEGQFDAAKDATYAFRLVSDDGAVLYIDNEKVVDNDGVHTVKDITASKALRAGRHALRLDYFQGKKGTVALQLQWGEGDALKPLVGMR
jgi:hypothetical protein